MLTKENKTGITNFFDNLKDWGGILEMIDGFAIGLTLTAIDKKGLDQINPVYHNVINEIIAHFLIKEYIEAKQKSAILLANVINTPLIDGTAEENAMYLQILNAIHAIIENLLAKQNENQTA